MAIYPFKGSNYGLLMNPLAPGAEVANDIYDNCKKLDEAGNVVSQGEDCVVYVIQYMVDALIRFWPGEDEAVMVRQSLTIGQPSAEGTETPQPGAKHESRATDGMSSHNPKRSTLLTIFERATTPCCRAQSFGDPP